MQMTGTLELSLVTDKTVWNWTDEWVMEKLASVKELVLVFTMEEPPSPSDQSLVHDVPCLNGLAFFVWHIYKEKWLKRREIRVVTDLQIRSHIF